MELTTAVQHGIPVKHVLLDNHALGKIGKFKGELQKIFLIRVVYHRYNQPCRCIHCYADIVVILENHFTIREVERRIQLRILLERMDHRFEDEAGQRECGALLLEFGRVSFMERHQIRNVGILKLMEI